MRPLDVDPDATTFESEVRRVTAREAALRLFRSVDPRSAASLLGDASLLATFYAYVGFGGDPVAALAVVFVLRTSRFRVKA